MKLSQILPPRAMVLVNRMYANGYYYDPYRSRRGYRAFTATGSTFPLVFTSWRDLTEWMKEVF